MTIPTPDMLHALADQYERAAFCAAVAGMEAREAGENQLAEKDAPVALQFFHLADHLRSYAVRLKVDQLNQEPTQ